MSNKYFNSRYPILEATMNRGSTLPLALACHEAGIHPSLVVPFPTEGIDTYDKYDQVDKELGEFVKCTGSSDIIFAIDPEELFDNKLMKIIKSHKISHLEIFPNLDPSTAGQGNIVRTRLGHEGYDRLLKLVFKNIYPTKIMQRVRGIGYNPFNVAYCLKGSDAGGFNSMTHTTRELFNEQQKLTPDAVLIPYGGVGTPQQVAQYLKDGATAVAVGTLLAASRESTLSMETKTAMVNSKKEDLCKLSHTNQNALILGDKQAVESEFSVDWNREYSLTNGLHGNSQVGHMYAGPAIDYVNEIKSVKEIVRYLISELPEYN